MRVSRSSAVPLHEQISTEIERRIRACAWGRDGKIPTEVELQRRYRVSRITVRHALRTLSERGVIARYPGRGSFATGAPAEENLQHFINFMNEQGEMEGKHRVLSAGVVPAVPGDAAVLGVAPGSAVVRLRRMKLDDDSRPVALEDQLVPFAIAPDILNEDLETLHVYSYFRAHSVHAEEARLYVAPHGLASDEASLLEMEPGAPVFRWERISYGPDRAAIELSRFLIRGDVRRFYVHFSLAARRPQQL